MSLIYVECRECGFDAVIKSHAAGGYYCPICAGDSGRDVRAAARAARGDAE